MPKAESVHSTPPLNTSSRRKFLTQAAAAVAGGATIGVALPLPGAAVDASTRLLTLEKQIFEAYDAAAAYKEDIMRCMSAWRDGLLKLEEEAEAGICTLDKAERWEAMSNMFDRDRRAKSSYRSSRAPLRTDGQAHQRNVGNTSQNV